MIMIRIPTPLRNLTDGNDEVEVSGASVGEALADLAEQYDGLKERLYDENGKIRRFVNLYLNNEDIRFLDHLQTQLKDGDELSIVPSVAGG